MTPEPRDDVEPNWTAADALARLRVLEQKLEAEGLYVSATTCFMARMVILSLLSEVAAQNAEQDDDGQPDEAKEWSDYDTDC